MKKLILFGTIALAAAGLTSCDDFLNDNRYPLDKQTDNPNYWNNASNVQKQVDALYANYTGYGNGGHGNFYYQTLTDDQATGVGAEFTNWKFTNVPSTNGNYTNPYIQIRRCNYVINTIPGTTLPDNDKKKFIGIARMNRALQYFWLVRAYGNVPYTDKVVDAADTETLYAPATDRDVIMDNVLEDLNYAAANIGNGTKTTWSSDMANAMKADICLWEGTYCKYRTAAENGKPADVARANKFLNACVDACKAIMAKSYTLNSSYIANYNTPTSLESNPEMIFYKAYLMSTKTNDLLQYLTNTTTIAGISKDAFDSYLFKDGKPLALTSMDKNDAGYVKKGIVSGVGAKAELGDILYIGDVLSVRDKRLYETIDTVVGYGSTSEGMLWCRAGSNLLNSGSGYLVRKYDNPDIPLQYRLGSSYICSPIYWLSVVYCNYAEALAELGTLTDADLDASINKLYARAELPAQTVASLTNMNDPANDMNVSSLIWEVRRCRRCELIMDNDFRYWDLIRWHQLDRLDTQKNPDIRLGANLKNGKAAYQFMDGDYMKATPNNERIYEAKHYFFPVPQTQINLNSNLKQNPGWESTK